MPIVNKLKHHKLLLDTHVWLWLMMGNSQLTPTFCKAVTQSQNQNNILISPITIWEIGMLVEKKRIALDRDCLDWVEKSLDSPGVLLAPITPKIAIQSTRLPGLIHGDPADRLLIATAHEEGAVFVTCDNKLLEYGKDRFVSVHNPST